MKKVFDLSFGDNALVQMLGRLSESLLPQIFPVSKEQGDLARVEVLGAIKRRNG